MANGKQDTFDEKEVSPTDDKFNSVPGLTGEKHDTIYDPNDYKSILADPNFSWSPEEEKRLLRKVDWNMVPFMSLLYLLSFLDRVNIGQARLNGLEVDLGLKGTQYLTCLTIFFVGYVIFETPSNIALKYLKPSRWITFIIICWSIVMTLMGTVTSYAGLATARFFLGVAECGLFPGICYALICWYKRREANLRISLFFSAATLAGAFGGLLAYGIGHMDGIGGKGGWAWIFILEGLATFCVGLLCPFFVHDFPEDARFLTPRERAIVIRRLEVDHGAAGDAPFNPKHIWSAVKEWKVWIYMLNYIGVATPLYALALFSPTIIANLGTWTRAQSQLLTVPPYVLGFGTTVITALISDKLGKRGIFMLFWMTWTILGYILIISVDVTKHPAQAYIGLYFAISGVSPCISTCITWCGTNLGPTYKRATGMGMMFTLGNSGGIIASESYRPGDGPRFIRGHALSLGFAGLSLVTSLILLFFLNRENNRRDALLVSSGDATLDEETREGMLDGRAQLEASPEQVKMWGYEGKTKEELMDLGDRHLGFRYIL